MKVRWPKLNRSIHYWISPIIALPILIVIITGLLLIVRKEITWIQSPTQKGDGYVPTITFSKILEMSKTVPEAEIKSWRDIPRLDIRPGKGVIKVRSHNRWGFS